MSTAGSRAARRLERSSARVARVPPDASPWTRGDVHKEIQLYQPLAATGNLTTTTHTDFREWAVQPRAEQRATSARRVVPFQGTTTTHSDFQMKELPRRAVPRPAEARPTLPFTGESHTHHDFPVWEQPCAARPAGARRPGGAGQ